MVQRKVDEDALDLWLAGSRAAGRAFLMSLSIEDHARLAGAAHDFESLLLFMSHLAPNVVAFSARMVERDGSPRVERTFTVSSSPGVIIEPSRKEARIVHIGGTTAHVPFGVGTPSDVPDRGLHSAPARAWVRFPSDVGPVVDVPWLGRTFKPTALVSGVDGLYVAVDSQIIQEIGKRDRRRIATLFEPLVRDLGSRVDTILQAVRSI